MKKFLVIFLILFLILFTALIKNSTKRVDDEIFVTRENIRSLNKDYENMKLENNYLGSTEKLIEYKKLFFEEDLIEKNIQEIRIISQKYNNLIIKKFNFIENK
tara:strand:- start:427 stop:735 length:309 start_codon:yes stop_codon:yes gene_type:complete